MPQSLRFWKHAQWQLSGAITLCVHSLQVTHTQQHEPVLWVEFPGSFLHIALVFVQQSSANHFEIVKKFPGVTAPMNRARGSLITPRRLSDLRCIKCEDPRILQYPRESAACLSTSGSAPYIHHHQSVPCFRTSLASSSREACISISVSSSLPKNAGPRTVAKLSSAALEQQVRCRGV